MIEAFRTRRLAESARKLAGSKRADLTAILTDLEAAQGDLAAAIRAIRPVHKTPHPEGRLGGLFDDLDDSEKKGALSHD